VLNVVREYVVFK